MPAPEVRLLLWWAAGVAGLMVGSFLNVVIFRLPRECMSIVRPRSRCVSCLRSIPWHENIPLVSFVLLGGRCRGCGTPIGWRYPAVEALTGLVFFGLAWAWVWASWEPVRAAVLAVVFSGMIAGALIDLDFKILPDEITLPGIVFGLAMGAAWPQWHGEGLPEAIGNRHVAGLVASAVGAAVGFGLLWLVRAVGQLVFGSLARARGLPEDHPWRGEVMGWGDVKLMGAIGALAGWDGALGTFVLACLVGSLVGGLLALRGHGREIPFGPYLCAGAVVMLLAKPQLVEWLRRYAELVQGG